MAAEIIPLPQDFFQGLVNFLCIENDVPTAQTEDFSSAQAVRGGSFPKQTLGASLAEVRSTTYVRLRNEGSPEFLSRS